MPVHRITTPAISSALPKLVSLMGMPKPMASNPSTHTPTPAASSTIISKPHAAAQAAASFLGPVQPEQNPTLSHNTVIWFTLQNRKCSSD